MEAAAIQIPGRIHGSFGVFLDGQQYGGRAGGGSSRDILFLVVHGHKHRAFWSLRMVVLKGICKFKGHRGQPTRC